MDYYRNQNKSAQEVSKIFENRQLAKQTNLMKMLAFVNENGCLRQNLLAHFDEEEPKHDEQCCGIDCALDAISTLHLDTKDIPWGKIAYGSSLIPWQTRLNQLFSQKN